MNEPQSALLTVAQVAERFQVGSKTVLRWVNRGILKGVKISKRILRFRQEDIEEMLKR